MRQARSDLNADSTARRKNRRPAFTVVAGLIAFAIAVVVVERSGGDASAGNDPAYSSVVPLAAPLGEIKTSITNTMSASDPAKPHFERSDEPANDDDSVHPHGG